MRYLSIVVVCIVSLTCWLWNQNTALHAELEILEDERSGVSDTSSNHSKSYHVDSAIQKPQSAISTIEEAELELRRYPLGNITKEASLGSKIFELKEGQLPKALEILTNGPAIRNSSLGQRASPVQALFEHWSRLNLKEAKSAADSLSGDSKTTALRGIVLYLIDTDLDAAIEIASTHEIKSKISGMGDMLYGPVIAAMAKRDPRRAAEFVLNDGSFDDSSDGTGSGSLMVARIWAETDPLAALEWARQHENLDLVSKSLAVSQIHAVWAQRDRRSAIDSVLSLEERDGRERSLQRLIYDWAQHDKDAALRYLTNELPELHRSVTLFEEAGRFFSRASPEAVISTAQNIDDIELREGFLGKAAETLGEYDSNAIVLASHLREGPLKDRVLQSVMKNWVQFDLEAASDWLGSAQDSPSRDAAVQAFASKLVASDPEWAIEWAASISNAEQREKSIELLAGTWLMNDSESATQWIKQSKVLSDTSKERILK